MEGSHLVTSAGSSGLLRPFLADDVLATYEVTHYSPGQYGFNLWPRVFSFTTYTTIFAIPDFIISSYM
ncbi:MAG: hypothetical protein FWC73_13525 [Defluviitaleaceae bacterium]|nr:hypothetical protein [Defluviitaleaceae bacterium]